MTKTQATPKELENRNPDAARAVSVRGKVCACSRPAAVRKMGSWVCARCARIEREHFGGGDSHQACGRGRGTIV